MLVLRGDAVAGFFVVRPLAFSCSRLLKRPLIQTVWFPERCCFI